MSIVPIYPLEFNHCDDTFRHITTDSLWDSGAWIFRGQGNKDHALLPSVLRDVTAKNNKLQIAREWYLLKRFSTYADQQGLQVPFLGDFDNIRRAHKLVKKCVSGEERWPPKEIHSLMALAQHYGIQTRILDWTRAPLTGLYFAAHYAVKETQDKSQVILFALNEKISILIQEAYNQHKQHLAPIKTMLRTIDVPYAGNPNITAQQGVFTCTIDRKVDPEAPVCPKTVEQTVVELADTLNTLQDSALEKLEELIHHRPLLVKVSLAGNVGKPLLHKLALRFRVNGSSLFPGYNGAVRSVEDLVSLFGNEIDEFAAGDLDFINSLPD